MKERTESRVQSSGRNKNLEDKEKHTRTSPELQFTESSLTKLETRPCNDTKMIRKKH